LEQRAKYLLEAYVPRGQIPEVAEHDGRLQAAAREMETEGRRIDYVGTLLIPEEEICFFLFEAVSAEDVAELSRRAAIGFERIVRAL